MNFLSYHFSEQSVNNFCLRKPLEFFWISGWNITKKTQKSEIQRFVSEFFSFVFACYLSYLGQFGNNHSFFWISVMYDFIFIRVLHMLCFCVFLQMHLNSKENSFILNINSQNLHFALYTKNFHHLNSQCILNLFVLSQDILEGLVKLKKVSR